MYRCQAVPRILMQQVNLVEQFCVGFKATSSSFKIKVQDKEKGT